MQIKFNNINRLTIQFMWVSIIVLHSWRWCTAAPSRLRRTGDSG